MWKCDMWECNNMKLWNRESVTVLQRASVTVWHCDNVTMWQRDSVTVWLCARVTLWQCDSITVWKCDFLTVWQCYNMKHWPCDSVTLWQCNSVTVFTSSTRSEWQLPLTCLTGRLPPLPSLAWPEWNNCSNKAAAGFKNMFHYTHGTDLAARDHEFVDFLAWNI